MKTFKEWLLRESEISSFNFDEWPYAMDWAEEYQKTKDFVYWIYECYREKIGRGFSERIPNPSSEIEDTLYNISYVFMEVLAKNLFHTWNEVVTTGPGNKMNWHKKQLELCNNWLLKDIQESEADKNLRKENLQIFKYFLVNDTKMWQEVPRRFKNQTVN